MPLQTIPSKKPRSVLNTVRQRTFNARAQLAPASGDIQRQQDVAHSIPLRKELLTRLQSMQPQNIEKTQTLPAPATPSASGEERSRSTQGGHGLSAPPAKALETSRFAAPERVSMSA